MDCHINEQERLVEEGQKRKLKKIARNMFTAARMIIINECHIVCLEKPQFKVYVVIK
jgi:hypothetical protein